MPLAPVNVITGETAFLQTLVVPDIVAVGNGLTRMVFTIESIPQRLPTFILMK